MGKSHLRRAYGEFYKVTKHLTRGYGGKSSIRRLFGYGSYITWYCFKPLDMSDYTVSRKRKRHAVDPCLGFHLLSSGKVLSSPSSGSNNSLGSNGFKVLAACTDCHDSDALVPSFVENKRGTEGIRDAPQNRHPEDLLDYGLQHTPEYARQMQPKNSSHEDLNSSSNIASDSGQLMMTVEDFLKRSNKRERPVKKQYGKKTRTCIKRPGDNDTLFEAERQYGIFRSGTGDTSQDFMQLRSKNIRRATMYESSSDKSLTLNHEESSLLEIKRKKNRGRTQKPFKERLYEAAVRAHGHPDDILVYGATAGSDLAPSRRPLRFIPNTQPGFDDSQTDKRRPRTWSLVDPRKSMAMRTASFSSKIRPCLQHVDSTSSGKTTNLSVQPQKRWKFTDASLAYSSLSNLKSNRQPKIPAEKAHEYPPLAFVSLREAEEDYQSMFSYDNRKRSGRLPNIGTASTLRMVSVAETVSHVEGRMSNPAVPTYDMHMPVPLEEVIQRPNFAIEVSAQVAVDQIGTLKNLNYMPPASLDSSPMINSISSPTLPATSKSIQDRPIGGIAPARHGSSRADVREHASIRRGSDVSVKPMRPLASFFNEFIQNIRNVTASQDQPSKHLVSKRPLRKASRNEHSAMLLQPPAINLTDMTEGIFVSQQARTNDLESIHQNDPNHRDHMNRPHERTPDLSYNHRLSPDILTVFEPQNYQVILSSLP